MEFVHLHVHTQYSLLDGAAKLQELLPRVKSLGMTAVAMTDHGSMFGAVEFHREAVRHGIKPLIGCELYVAPGSRRERRGRPDDPEGGGNFHLVVLAMNREGYRNLCQLVSRAYQEGFYYKPRVDRELLAELSGGLIALSACLRGEVAAHLAAGRPEAARAAAEAYARMFPGRFYLELQDNRLPEQAEVNAELRHLARSLGLPVVATNDCHYLSPEDAAAHEVLLCIQTGKTLADEKRWRFATDQLYLKSPAEMAAAFADVPEALSATCEIARRCDLELKQRFRFPEFTPPAGLSLEEYLGQEARRGLAARLAERFGPGEASDGAAARYRERLEHELEVITGRGLAGYFLIVADFVNFARRQGIPVGPGRGSAAGSLVAYALGITGLDPIEHGLLFERFLNPERRSLPDIDVDFCFERRDEVIRYVREKYGADRVAQIVTFGTLRGKQAIKDVGRVLGLSFAETDRIAKLYPAPKQGREYPLAAALRMEPRLKELRDRGAREGQLFEYALRLEGLLRHASKHAAGIVISSRPLTEDVPLLVDKDGAVMTQYAGGSIEAVGLVKFDLLGLKNLTLLHDVLSRIRRAGAVPPDLDRVPLDDPETYALLARGDTVGVFQMESAGMRRVLTQLRPSCFADIVAVLALFRPGPLDAGMVEQFIKRKHGLEPISYPHPALEPILRDTYGVIVYQEQVMQIAQVLAGYSLGDADILRRAMGKKKKEVMTRERERFCKGAAARGVEPKKAAQIFDQMETFAGYGFNKSHAAAYALISYQTAYLKAHHAQAFMASLLSLEMGDTDRTYRNLAACRERGLAILPPDVNESYEDFTAAGDHIRFGLGAVKGVGSKAIEAILAARAQGPFSSLHDFCLRVRGQQVNRRVLESLIKCGAFDSLEPSRARLLAGLEDVMRWAAQREEERERRQMALFGGADGEGAPPPPLPEVADWGDRERLAAEREALGFFITGHPLDRYAGEIERLTNATTAGLRRRADKGAPGPPTDGRWRVRLGGVVHTLKLKNSKRGERYATFLLEDRAGVVEVVAWPDTYRRCEAAVHGGEPVLVAGTVEVGEDRCQVIADEITPLGEARAGAVRQVHVRVPLARVGRDGLEELRATLKRFPGTCPAFLHLERPDHSETVLALPAELRVAATEQMVDAVERVLGAGVTSFR